MRPLIMAAILGLGIASAAPAFAQWTGQRIGQFDYWSGPSGRSVTCQHIGQFTYCN